MSGGSTSLSGTRKAAILLSLLGDEPAAAICAIFPTRRSAAHHR
jgi:flagellar motor switch protein FliG